MYWIFELNKLCCSDKRAHVRLTDGEEFDCTPDCLTYDGNGNEEMLIRMDDGGLRTLSNDEISNVVEI